jgi:hypothetical protein
VKPFLSRVQAFFLVIKNLSRGPKNFQMVMLQSFPVNFSQSVSGANHPRSFCRQKQSSARPLQFARRIIKIKSAESPVATRPTGYKKGLQVNTHRLFFF